MAYDTPESMKAAYLDLHRYRRRKRYRWDEPAGALEAQDARLAMENAPPVWDGPLFERKRKRSPSPDLLQSHKQVSVDNSVQPSFFDNDYHRNPMSDVDARTERVQKQLEQDNVELQLYQGEVPLHFEFVRTAAELDKGDLEACFRLIEATSGHDYKASSMGWKPKKKKEEMKDKAMMYLLVKGGDSAAGKVLGFISFMFTFDDPPHDSDEVVYIYEVHLNEGLRGRGLGSRLITFVEVACRRCGILKTMLTVFKSNAAARELYKKLGFGKDDCSPEDRVVRGRTIEADYLILSKSEDKF